MECWVSPSQEHRTFTLYFALPLHPICNLNSSSFFQIPGFSALRSDWAQSRSGLFLLMPCTLAAASTFSSSKVLSFCVLSTSSLSLLDPNSGYVRINTSLNNSFSLSFFSRSLTRSCFLLLLLGRLFLLSFPHYIKTCLSFLWSPPFPLHAPDLILSISPRCGSRSP